MTTIRAIRTDEDYENALERIQELLDVLSGDDGQIEDPEHPARIELDVLSDLVEHYEGKTVEIGYPDPVAAIQFRMDQVGLTPRDLVPFIGSRSKVSEVLSGKRAITMPMARALHQHLGIAADILLQQPGTRLPDATDDIDWTKFPLRAMANAGWIPSVQRLKDNAEDLVSTLMQRAGVSSPSAAMLYRKNDHRRLNAKTDDYALQAWCWQVMAQARERVSIAPYTPGVVDSEFLRNVAQLSVEEDGPTKARTMLAQSGIGFEVVHHLPKTYLDGAAFLLDDGRPVIGITLRYDRIDNFWFTLLHELAHVGLHLEEGGEDSAFVDDLSLRDVDRGSGDTREQQADEMAEEALIPWVVWVDSPVRQEPTPMRVLNSAHRWGVHPAVIAGRVRHERGNYRLLTQFVGTGEVRWQFEESQEAATT